MQRSLNFKHRPARARGAHHAAVDSWTGKRALPFFLAARVDMGNHPHGSSVEATARATKKGWTHGAKRTGGGGTFYPHFYLTRPGSAGSDQCIESVCSAGSYYPVRSSFRPLFTATLPYSSQGYQGLRCQATPGKVSCLVVGHFGTATISSFINRLLQRMRLNKKMRFDPTTVPFHTPSSMMLNDFLTGLMPPYRVDT